MNDVQEIILADNAEAYALLGERDEFLTLLSEGFKAKLVSRGNKITASGEEAAAALSALTELQYLYRQGCRLTAHEVSYAVRLVRAGQSEELHALFGDTVLVTAKGKHIRPKTLGQRRYLDAIRQNVVTLALGPAGTGKTYLAVVMAVAALRRQEVKRLILSRPAVEAGERLGFLPGDMQEKVDPYLRPLYDALQDILSADMYQKFTAKGLIEVAPLAYMRGRTLDNAFVILDEAQNTTEKQLKMFLTRLGFGSRMVVTGDLTQADLPRGVTSGLKTAGRILEGVKGVGLVRLESPDIIRHEVVARIAAAYERYEQSCGKEGEG